MIAIVLNGHLCMMPRPLKEAVALKKAGYDVVLFGGWFDEEKAELDQKICERYGVDFKACFDARGKTLYDYLGKAGRKISSPNICPSEIYHPSQYGIGCQKILSAVRTANPKHVIGHGEIGLFVATEWSEKRKKFGVDFEDWYSHDLPPEQRKSRPLLDMKKRESYSLRHASYRVTTSHALAKALEEWAHIDSPSLKVVANSFSDEAIEERSPNIVPTLHWFSQTIGPARGLELLFESLRMVSTPFELKIQGNLPAHYQAWFQEKSEGLSDSIKLLNPVRPWELQASLSRSDIGLALETKEIPSRNLTITNKMMQYIQAGLALAASNTRGQREVMRDQDIGLMHQHTSANQLAENLERLMSDDSLGQKCGENSRKLFEEKYRWEIQEERIIQEADKAFGKSVSLHRVRKNKDTTKRVLIVSPHFPPVNAPDCQRVRMMLPYLREFGWQPEVLACFHHQINHSYDHTTFEKKSAPIHLVKSDPIPFHRFGIRSCYWNHKFQIDFRGSGLANAFDLIFFSTTQFPFMQFGADWKRDSGTPYVLDYQDPWITDYYHHNNIKPPGGWLKYNINQRMAKRAERKAVENCDGIVSVSDVYIQQLKDRYPSVSVPTCVEPFAAPTMDLEHAVEKEKSVGIQLLYAGRGGSQMLKAARPLLNCIRKLKSLAKENKLNLKFIGTSYTQTNEKPFLSLAKENRVESFVEEVTDRFPQYETLGMMKQSDVLLIFGTGDRNYSPSKLLTALMLRKPVLFICHEKSPALDLAQKLGGSTIICFDENGLSETEQSRLEETCRAILNRHLRCPPLNEKLFEYYTAPQMTKRLANFFDEVVS